MKQNLHNSFFVGLVLSTISFSQVFAQEEKISVPAITITTEAEGSFNLNLGTQNGGILNIDWGDGVLQSTEEVKDSASIFKSGTPSGTSISGNLLGNTIKIYGNDIIFLKCTNGNITGIENEAPLLYLDITGNKLESIDLKNYNTLSGLILDNNEIKTLDLSPCAGLLKLSCVSLPVETIDLSVCPLLTDLKLSETLIKEIDITQNPELSTFYAENLGIDFIDFSKSKKLTHIRINNNKFSELDVSECDALVFLYAYENRFSTKDGIKFPNKENNSVFKMMNIKNNDYKLSTFPDAEESFCVAKYTYTYAPQNDILIDPIIYVDEIIDFSSEVNTKGILAESAATTFTWRNATGELLIENEDYEVVSDGIFKFIKAQDEPVLCQFSSAAFPKLKDSDILKTTLATVKEKAPVITFTTEKTSEITLGFARQNGGTLFVDWGDGNLIETISVTDSLTAMSKATISGTSIKGTPVGSTIKIYCDDLILFNTSDNDVLSIDIDAPQLVYLNIAKNAKIESLDLTGMPEARVLEMTDVTFSTLDLSKTPKLMRLVATNMPIESIDLTVCPDMYFLRVDNTSLKELNIQANKNLGLLYAGGIGLNSLDLSNKTKLTYLSVGNNNLTSLDLAACDTLIFLYANNNLFSKKDDIIFPVQEKVLVFKNMNLKSCNYTLSELPEIRPVPTNANKFTYSYAPQNDYQIHENISMDELVDLSTENNLTGILSEPVKTTYTWLSEDGDPLVKDEDYEETDEGVFKFLKTPEKKVLCQLSTTAFPDFKNNNIYKTTLASISEASSLDTETVEDLYINTGKNFISVINGKSQLISIYNISGIKIAEFTDSEKSIVTIQGIYIIKSENKAIKVIVE